mmetsp:Transcript_23583/g.67575  ORF Transcript_23583/g.67575 Transcript_23583/m.67575 type:complete len:240 (+) Transcript_23583:181-900(+)
MAPTRSSRDDTALGDTAVGHHRRNVPPQLVPLPRGRHRPRVAPEPRRGGAAAAVPIRLADGGQRRARQGCGCQRHHGQGPAALRLRGALLRLSLERRRSRDAGSGLDNLLSHSARKADLIDGDAAVVRPRRRRRQRPRTDDHLARASQLRRAASRPRRRHAASLLQGRLPSAAFRRQGRLQPGGLDGARAADADAWKIGLRGPGHCRSGSINGHGRLRARILRQRRRWVGRCVVACFGA